MPAENAMVRVDVNPSARELVDLSAESIRALGAHLEQIGGIISGTELPRRLGDRGATSRIKEKLMLYKKFQSQMCTRQDEVEARLAADFAELAAWRKDSGTEGADMLEELEAYIRKCRELSELLKCEKMLVSELRQNVTELKAVIVMKDRQCDKLSEAFVRSKEGWKQEVMHRGAFSSWLQCSFDEVRFRFKAQQERERLMIEHHRKMRKTRAEGRLACIDSMKDRRALQLCILALQEEAVERRTERHLNELRTRHRDEVLIYQGQIAQLLGDEEKAKEIVAEQVRRMEEARRKQKDAERQRDEYKKQMKKAIEEKEEAMAEKEEALKEKALALELKQVAEDAAEEAKANEKAAVVAMDKALEELSDTQDHLAKTQRELKRKNKKVESLQRMLAELGAESDSDAPPDERAPPFFTNEDGSRVPRPRTRKERMAMAYREAESARCELRLGMAAMIDKDINVAQQVNQLRLELTRAKREILELRLANKAMAEDAKALARRPATSGGVPVKGADGEYAPYPAPPAVPFAPSLAAAAAAPFYANAAPRFVPSGSTDESPRVLHKVASQPVFFPQICSALDADGNKIDRITLAPLRTVKRPMSEWKVNWH